MKNLPLSDAEIGHLLDLLHEEGIRMDDEGNEGAFRASPLSAIERRLRTLSRESR
jgi:hypothetical protein